MDAALAARLPLEVLHGVGDEHLAARDAGFLERAIEHAARRPDERLPRAILLIPGLLTHDEHAARGLAFTEHAVCGVLVKRTPATVLHRLGQLLQRPRGGHEGRRIHVFGLFRFYAIMRACS